MKHFQEEEEENHSRLSRLKLLTHLQLISIKNKIETLQSGTWLLLDDGDRKKKNDIRKKGEEKPQEAAAKKMAGGAS